MKACIEIVCVGYVKFPWKNLHFFDTVIYCFWVPGTVHCLLGVLSHAKFLNRCKRTEVMLVLPPGDLSDCLSQDHAACFTKLPRTKQTSRLNILKSSCTLMKTALHFSKSICSNHSIRSKLSKHCSKRSYKIRISYQPRGRTQV